MKSYAEHSLVPASYNLTAKIPLATWLFAAAAGVALWWVLLGLIFKA